ncbi:MAG: hypothetical protein ABI851_13085 [Saprospiraceae bacterium]
MDKRLSKIWTTPVQKMDKQMGACPKYGQALFQNLVKYMSACPKNGQAVLKFVEINKKYCACPKNGQALVQNMDKLESNLLKSK